MPEFKKVETRPQPINERLRLASMFPKLPQGIRSRFGAEAEQYDLEVQKWWSSTKKALTESQYEVAMPQNTMRQDIENITKAYVAADRALKASIDTERNIRVNADEAFAEQIETLESEFNAVGQALEARVETIETTYATQTFAEAKKTEAIAAAAAGAEVMVEDEALARAQSDGYLAGHRVIRVNAGGKAAGMAITAIEDPSGWETTSTIDFLADVFRISTGDNPEDVVTPFSLSGSQLQLNAQLVVNGLTLQTIAENGALPPINYIGAFASAPDPAPYDVNSVYLNTTDGNSYIRTNISTWALFLAKGSTGATGATGAQGPTGDTGANGERGSKAFFATIAGTSWSDSAANTAITSAGYTKVPLDQVTLTNAGAGYAETRFWTGSAWATIAQVINGNLLVNGTVGMDKLIAGSVWSNTVDIGTASQRVHITGSEFTYGNRLKIWNPSSTANWLAFNPSETASKQIAIYGSSSTSEILLGPDALAIGVHHGYLRADGTAEFKTLNVYNTLSATSYVGISASMVGGLAASATTNALNASNINAGTLDTARLPGIIDIATGYRVGGTQVVGARQGAIANAGTSNNIDATYNESQLEALFNAFGSKINEVLAAMRTHGLIAT